MLAYMDPTTDPCDDFYRFACGGFAKNVFLDPYENSFTSFTVSTLRLKVRLHEILSDNNGTQDESKPYRLAKSLFNGCTNNKIIKSRGMQPLHDLLDTLGGWPVVTGGWNEEAWTWQNLLIGYRKVGAPWDHFFNLEHFNVLNYNVSAFFCRSLNSNMIY